MLTSLNSKAWSKMLRYTPKTWGGADYIVDKNIPAAQNQKESFYPSPLTICHPNAEQIVWLIYALQGFARMINYEDSRYFIAKLGDVICVNQAKSLNEILNIMLNTIHFEI